MKQLTQEQIEQQDFVDNTIMDFLNSFLQGREFEYTDEPVYDAVCEIREILIELFEKTDSIPEMDFYPYLEE